MLTGDFNARTGTLPDYIYQDESFPEHFIPLPPDYQSDNERMRASQDEVINNYGRELLDLCISSRLRIVNFVMTTTVWTGSPDFPPEVTVC